MRRSEIAKQQRLLPTGWSGRWLFQWLLEKERVMNGKGWVRTASTLCLGLLILAAGTAWSSPGDLSAATGEELVVALPPAVVQSTYFYYKYGSMAYAESGTFGTCREHRHYSSLNCVNPTAPTFYFDVCP
jgi:hypothetical protein